MTTTRNRPAEHVTPDRREYVPPIETHLIRSKYVRQSFRIQVMQPVRSIAETTRFPVVYTTDANLTFDMFKGFSYLIQSSEQAASRFILVGIGYPSDCPYAGAVLRGRDLTFHGYPRLMVRPPAIEGVLTVEEGTKDFYGAEDFQRFIALELIPLIEERYPTIPEARTYFGHSGGGGFGLFTLFTLPDLFRNYIVSSPGLIFHGESSAGIHYENYDFMLREARKFIASGKALNGSRLYMSVGANEEHEPGLAQWQLTSSFYRMAALLRAGEIRGLELMTEIFPGETHNTACPMAFLHGVQAVLGMRDASQTRSEVRSR
jgi:uncharacterized protein